MDLLTILSGGADLAIIYLAAKLKDLYRRVNLAEKTVGKHVTDIAILKTQNVTKGNLWVKIFYNQKRYGAQLSIL